MRQQHTALVQPVEEGHGCCNARNLVVPHCSALARGSTHRRPMAAHSHERLQRLEHLWIIEHVLNIPIEENEARDDDVSLSVCRGWPRSARDEAGRG
jgi:hypothetical protein